MGAGPAGAAARARLQGAALAQAAQAFRAALPGRGLPDFLRWLALVGARVGLAPLAGSRQRGPRCSPSIT